MTGIGRNPTGLRARWLRAGGLWGARLPRGLFVLVMAVLAVRPAAGLAQQNFVAGMVVDQRSLLPLSGAQIEVLGMELGAIADPRGRFRIQGVSGQEVTLRVTLLGYRTVDQRVRVGDASARIALEEMAIALDEIVVTGTPGGVQRRSLGNAVAQINAIELNEIAPIDNVSQLLNARAPGVVLQAQQGTAGGGNRILIRGRGSMQFAGNPLIYVDGVRVNNDFTTGPSTPEAGAPIVLSRLDDIDPSDIERVEIIKGPAAATLYGTEASAGVIQIITKRGREGAARFGVRVRQGVNWLPDREEVVGISWGRDAQSGQVFQFNALDVLKRGGFDLFRTGHTQGYGVDVTGGVPGVQYYVSADWDREEGIVPTNTAEKFRGRLNLTFQPRENLTVNANFGVTTGRTDTYHVFYFFAARYALPALRNAPVRGFSTGIPPDVRAQSEEIYQDLARAMAGLQIDYRPFEWFRHRLTAGLDLTDEENVWLIPFVPDKYATFYGPTGRLGQKTVTGFETEYTTLDYSGTVELPINERLRSNTSVGLQYYRRLVNSDRLSGQQFPAPGLSSLAGITGPKQVSDDFVENTTVGLYVQQQLAWQDRLFLTGAIRADDNSAFGENFDFVTYPKLSASWVISEEPFWNLSWVNALKLRAAFGESGQQPDAFAAIRTYEPIAGRGDRPAGSPQFIGNPDLGPERGQELEVGFEGGLLQDRVGMDVTYYVRKTKDAIVSREVAPSTGFPRTQFINAGEVQNHGIELLLTGRPIQTRRVRWEMTFNFSRNWNEVVSLNVPGVKAIPTGWMPNWHRPGHPVAAFLGKKMLRAEIDATGRPVNVFCDDGRGNPVDCRTAPDTLFIGQNYPHTEGSVSTSLTLFERLRLHALLDFKLGRSQFSADKALRCAVFRAHEINFFPERFDPRDVAYCRFVPGFGFFDDRAILKADFAKLRELSMNYTLPADLAAMFGASRASITVAARNLYTWRHRSPFHTTDPEVFTAGNYGSSIHEQGIVPLPLQILTTINLSF